MLASSPVNSSPTLGPATPTTTTTTATKYLAKQDRDALYQYTKHFVRKAMQIIVQSRLGDKKPTKSRVYAYNADWFNLSVKDLLQIATMTKTSLGNVESLFTDNTPFCVEISLRTPENQTMILETWCILFNEQLADPTQKICYSVYKKMSLVLRSLICLTRSIPTYQLSRRQNSDTYVLLYRMYTGEPIVHVLGENYGTAKVGTVGTPIGSLIVNVAYRTRLTMTPQTSSHLGGEYATATGAGGIQIKDDHFVVAGSSSQHAPPQPSTPRQSTRMPSFASSPDINHQQQQQLQTPNYEDENNIANSYSPPPPYQNNKSPRLAFDSRTQSSDSVAAASPISRHSSSNLNTIDEAGTSTPETPTRLKNRATSKTQPIPMKSSQSQPQIATTSNQQQQQQQQQTTTTTVANITPRHKAVNLPPTQQQQGQQQEESSADEYSSSVGSTSDTIYYFKLKSAAFVPSVASASFSANPNQYFSSSSLANNDSTNDLPPFIALLSNDFANLSTNLQHGPQHHPQLAIDMAQSPPPPNSVIEFNMQQRAQAGQRQQRYPPSTTTTNQDDRIVSPCSLPNFKMLDHHHNQFLNSPHNYHQQQQHGGGALNLLNNQLEPDDFVFIESKKIAFGLSNAADDLRNFFRACENAPMLDSFQNEPLFNDVLKDLDQQLLGYESKVAEFDDLIKSLENN